MAGFVVPLVTAGLSALGGLFGNKKKQQEKYNNSTTNSSTTSTSGTTHDFTSEQQDLINRIMQNLAGQKSFDASGYTANGIRAINDGSSALQRSLKNVVAARGLSFSPAGFNPVAQAESNRIGQQNDFLATIPQVQQQYDQQNLENLIRGFGIMPTDTSTTSASKTDSVQNQKGTELINGNPVGGAITGGANGFIQGGGLDAILNLFKDKGTGEYGYNKDGSYAN